MAALIGYQGKPAKEIIDIPVTEEDKQTLKARMGIELDPETKVIHILSNSIHQYKSGDGGDDTMEQFYDLVNWDKYNKSGAKMSKIIHALDVRNFSKTRDHKYIKIQELADHKAADISSYKYLIKDDNGFRLEKEEVKEITHLYRMDEFEDFIRETTTPIKTSDLNTWLFDISSIYNEDNKRFGKVKRIIPTATKEEIIGSSFIKSVGGELSFVLSGTDVKTAFNREFPQRKIYDSTSEERLYSILGKRTPVGFVKGVKYRVRDWEDLRAEYGQMGTVIKNKNKFPQENKKHCGTEFRPDADDKSFTIGTNVIYPEETYEVDDMANPINKKNGYGATNIFTDEVIPEPPKPEPVKVIKIGKKYYQGQKEVVLADFACEVEIDEKEVNEKRFVAAMELGVDYDNLEEKSKRIQDIIKNELDSPEAIADKEWVYIYGASGSGKTTEAIKYFNDKGQDYIKQAGFGQLTGDDLLGYKSITEGTYFRSLLRDAVEHGKGYILDEADACNPNTLLVLNELKGEYMQFPDKKVKIHKDFRFIATGNTVGFSEDYNGRTKMDRATTARFSMIEYNLTLLDIGERWGGSYTKRIKDLENKEPREIQREIRQMKQKESKNA